MQLNPFWSSRTAPFAFVAILISLATTLFVTSVRAAAKLTEYHARVAAAKILKGDPYGDTFGQIMKNIEDAQLIIAGTVCGSKVTRPVWRFHVVVPKSRNPSGNSEINGFLVIDAQTGKMTCAGLPFLD